MHENRFVKKKINGICWRLPEEILGKDLMAAKKVFDGLSQVKEKIFFQDYGGVDVKVYQESDLKLCNIADKGFVPLKVGRKKIFGTMTFSDGSGEYDVYVKVFNCASLLLKIKHLFVSSKAHREFVLSFEIDQRGIPAVFAVASGDEKSWGFLQRSYLIVRKISGAVNMKEFFSGSASRHKDRRHVIEEFGRIARLSHDQGVLQTDFALNNFLVRMPNEKQCCVYMIDYERTTIRNTISHKKRSWVLAKLNRAGFDFSAAEKLRFLKSYVNSGQGASGRDTAVPDIRRWQQMIDRETMSILRNNAKRARKDCVAGERMFKVYNCNGVRGHYQTCYDITLLLTLIDNFSGCEREDGHMLADKAARITSVQTELVVNGVTLTVMIYRVEGDAGGKMGLDFWRNLNALIRGGQSVVEPIGFFDVSSRYRRAGKTSEPVQTGGYLITSGPGADTTETRGMKEFLRLLRQGAKRKIFLYRLAMFICRLHNAGSIAGDVHPGDIAVNIKDDTYKFCFTNACNLSLRLTMLHNDRVADVDKIIRHLSDAMEGDEPSYFRKVYTRNERWYYGTHA